MVKKKNQRKKVNMLKIGLALFSFSVILFILLQTLRLYENSKNNSQQDSNRSTEQESDENSVGPSRWSKYENEDYSISFDYPYLLHEVEYEEPGEYEFFVIFEENRFSKEKGVAFGVSSDGLEKEIERIKANVSKQSNSKLVKDEEYKSSCIKSWVLEYVSEDELMEKRSFFIFERGDYTFSFSTVPEQIQRLRNSISFTN
jgi:hypothetical protein